MEKHYIIPHSILVALMNYLVTRPYQEVEQGIAALKSLKEATDGHLAGKEAEEYRAGGSEPAQ